LDGAKARLAAANEEQSALGQGQKRQPVGGRDGGEAAALAALGSDIEDYRVWYSAKQVDLDFRHEGMAFPGGAWERVGDAVAWERAGKPAPLAAAVDAVLAEI
jgi:hypothetical protein